MRDFARETGADALLTGVELTLEEGLSIMNARSRSAVPTTNSAPNSGSLSFRRELLRPPQAQVTQYEDAVSQRVAALADRAAVLAAGFGISMTTYELNPPTKGAGDLALTMLELMVRTPERVTLERRDGRWGLFFTREPSMLQGAARPLAVPLKDAPLDVRERFLADSERFFREYLSLCENRLGKMKTAVDAADRTLALLQSITLA